MAAAIAVYVMEKEFGELERACINAEGVMLENVVLVEEKVEVMFLRGITNTTKESNMFNQKVAPDTNKGIEL